MSKKLFVGNLPFSATEDSLKGLFSQYGAVESVKIITDSGTGRSKGFGFVEMTNDAEADAAIAKLAGSDMEGRPLTVSEARPQQPRSPGGGRGGFDRGGRRPGGRGGFDRGGRGGFGGNRRSEF